MLELRGITAGYGETTVLREVNLTVGEGATVALLGANGAGKTTLLSVASGSIRPSDGQVLISGLDCTHVKPHERAALGVCHVPEGRGVFSTLTVRDNLILFGQDADDSIERAISAFPWIEGRLDQLGGTLSGGERQMLALARAYVQRPRLVMVDEVSMGLAPKVLDEIYAFLHRLTEEGTSLLLVEQYVAKALEIADYVVVLSRGQVSFLGEPSELDSDEIFGHYVSGAL